MGYSLLEEEPVEVEKDVDNPQKASVTMKMYPEGTWGPSHEHYKDEEAWDWDGKSFSLVNGLLSTNNF